MRPREAGDGFVQHQDQVDWAPESVASHESWEAFADEEGSDADSQAETVVHVEYSPSVYSDQEMLDAELYADAPAHNNNNNNQLQSEGSLPVYSSGSEEDGAPLNGQPSLAPAANMAQNPGFEIYVDDPVAFYGADDEPEGADIVLGPLRDITYWWTWGFVQYHERNEGRLHREQPVDALADGSDEDEWQPYAPIRDVRFLIVQADEEDRLDNASDLENLEHLEDQENW